MIYMIYIPHVYLKYSIYQASKAYHNPIIYEVSNIPGQYNISFLGKINNLLWPHRIVSSHKGSIVIPKVYFYIIQIKTCLQMIIDKMFDTDLKQWISVCISAKCQPPPLQLPVTVSEGCQTISHPTICQASIFPLYTIDTQYILCIVYSVYTN